MGTCITQHINRGTGDGGPLSAGIWQAEVRLVGRDADFWKSALVGGRVPQGGFKDKELKFFCEHRTCGPQCC